MTPGRFLLDEMLSPAIADQLRRRGHDDAYAIAERPDLVSLPDEHVLALGADERRVVVSLNIGDFVALHARWGVEGRSHAGLLLVAQRAFPQNQAFVGAVVRALDSAAGADQLPTDGRVRFLVRG